MQTNGTSWITCTPSVTFSGSAREMGEKELDTAMEPLSHASFLESLSSSVQPFMPWMNTVGAGQAERDGRYTRRIVAENTTTGGKLSNPETVPFLAWFATCK
jgi:hypothetical protein